LGRLTGAEIFKSCENEISIEIERRKKRRVVPNVRAFERRGGDWDGETTRR